MAMAAVDVQVSPRPRRQIGRCIVRIGKRLDLRRQRLGEEADVIKRVKLAGQRSSVIVFPLKLWQSKAVDRSGPRRVAEDALGAAGVMPGLTPLPSRCGKVTNLECLVARFIRRQQRV